VGPGSGLIIAFVVVVWAAYFIPLALRRYDEASKNASVETTGSLSRVINRPRASSATAATSATAPAAPEGVETVSPVAEKKPVAATSRPAAPRSTDRPAARRAAARRRRTLLTLVVLTAVVGGVAGFGVIALPWIAVPVGLVVAWLVACRVQVRRERGVARPAGSGRVRAVLGRVSFPRIPVPSLQRVGSAVAAAGATTAKAPRAKASRAKASRSAPASAAVEEDTVIVSGQFEDIDPGRKHVMEDVALEADALDDKIVIAVPSVSTAGEALWDPLPVTLPTYVTKPRAGRTVRTIDFSQPHTWTSGHIEGEDVELPKRSDDTGEHRRAVGH
jgi:hypothetical protein